MTRPDKHPDLLVRRTLRQIITDPASVTSLSPAGLDLALRLTRRARLLGWLGWQLQQNNLLDSLPQLAADQLKSALAEAKARDRISRWELDRITWALRDNKDITLIALKGCAYLLRELPNAGGRSFADIDLLLPKRDLEQAEQILVARGWQGKTLDVYDDNFYRVWSHELPPMIHREREVEVDLHHTILRKTARLKPDARLLLQNARPAGETGFSTLSDTDLLLHTMTHLMFDSDLGDRLRDLVDISMLLEYFSERDEDFWQKLQARARQLDLQRPAYYALRYANQLLGTPIPSTVAIKIDSPPAVYVWLMDRCGPAAIFPQHPDSPLKSSELARLLLYIRSHWISMPPLLLARHLVYKFYVRYIKDRLRTPKGQPISGQEK